MFSSERGPDLHLKCVFLLTRSSHIQLTSTAVLSSRLELKPLHVPHRVCLWKTEVTHSFSVPSCQFHPPAQRRNFCLFVCLLEQTRARLLAERERDPVRQKMRHTGSIFFIANSVRVSHSVVGARSELTARVGHKLLTHQQFARIRFRTSQLHKPNRK